MSVNRPNRSAEKHNFGYVNPRMPGRTNRFGWGSGASASEVVERKSSEDALEEVSEDEYEG